MHALRYALPSLAGCVVPFFHEQQREFVFLWRRYFPPYPVLCFIDNRMPKVPVFKHSSRQRLGHLSSNAAVCNGMPFCPTSNASSPVLWDRTFRFGRFPNIVKFVEMDVLGGVVVDVGVQWRSRSAVCHVTTAEEVWPLSSTQGSKQNFQGAACMFLPRRSRFNITHTVNPKPK